MQRGKNYNLEKTACFTVALFVFKMNKILKHYPYNGLFNFNLNLEKKITLDF
jgi:hypothetical protein